MKEQPSKEERKRLLIEMMKEDEKNGMYEVPNFVEPILLKAGDKCVKINGQHPYVDCRIISEDNYQLLLSTIQKLNKFKIQAYELQSASQFKPSGVKTLTEQEFCQMYSSCYGEEIDKVQQLRQANFTGEELMEFVDHCFQTRNNQTTL